MFVGRDIDHRHFRKEPVQQGFMVGTAAAPLWRFGCMLVAMLLCFAPLPCASSFIVPAYMPTDGSLHSPWQDPSINVVGARFQAISNPSYADNASTMIVTPNARVISNTVLSSAPFRSNSHGIAAFTAAWGQFMAHDLIMTASSNGNLSATNDLYAIPVPSGDAFMDPLNTGTAALEFGRCAWDLATGTSPSDPRRQLNGQTGWLDGSVVYGISDARTALLRSYYGGFLKQDATNGLPFNDGCYDMASGPNSPCMQRLAGDVRANVSPGIFSLQGLFVLEHNYWARKLLVANPGWLDEQLFQESRKRVVGELQAITINQYLPTIKGGVGLPAYGGFDVGVDAQMAPAFAAAAYRYGHAGVTNSYWCIKATGLQCPEGNLLVRDVYFNPSYLLTGTTIADVLRGMAAQLESAIDTSLVDDVRNFLVGLKQDLASLDIQRGRDFGLHSFAATRRDLGLPSPATFGDISSNGIVQRALSAAYGGNIEAVDLWVGGLAEAQGSPDFLGATFSSIITDQYRRTRDGDWFWYQNTANLGPTGARYLSDADIATIRATGIGDVIARNTDWTNAPKNIFVTSGLFAYSGADTNQAGGARRLEGGVEGGQMEAANGDEGNAHHLGLADADGDDGLGDSLSSLLPLSLLLLLPESITYKVFTAILMTLAAILVVASAILGDLARERKQLAADIASTTAASRVPGVLPTPYPLCAKNLAPLTLADATPSPPPLNEGDKADANSSPPLNSTLVTCTTTTTTPLLTPESVNSSAQGGASIPIGGGQSLWWTPRTTAATGRCP